MFKKTSTSILEDSVVFSGDYNKPLCATFKLKADGHNYIKDILENDVGCGMSAFIFDKKADCKEIADKAADYLKGRNVLGRGNHFIDICSGLCSEEDSYPPHYVVVIHSDGKQVHKTQPKTIDEAIQRVKDASEFRANLASDIAGLVKVNYERIGDWPHNSVEYQNGSVIYRKKTIKTFEKKLHIFTGSLGTTVMFYTFGTGKMPKLESMPHGSGRSEPLSQLKQHVTEDDVKGLRKMVYIPEMIKDSSLKSEHPKCYDLEFSVLNEVNENYCIVNEVKILAYVGKI